MACFSCVPSSLSSSPFLLCLLLSFTTYSLPYFPILFLSPPFLLCIPLLARKRSNQMKNVSTAAALLCPASCPLCCCRPFALHSPFCCLSFPSPSPTVRLLLLLPLTVSQAHIGSKRSNSVSVPCPTNCPTSLVSRLADTLYKRHTYCSSTKPLCSVRTHCVVFSQRFHRFCHSTFCFSAFFFLFGFSLCLLRITTRLHPQHAFPLSALSRTSHRIADRTSSSSSSAQLCLLCL